MEGEQVINFMMERKRWNFKMAEKYSRLSQQYGELHANFPDDLYATWFDFCSCENMSTIEEAESKFMNLGKVELDYFLVEFPVDMFYLRPAEDFVLETIDFLKSRARMMFIKHFMIGVGYEALNNVSRENTQQFGVIMEFGDSQLQLTEKSHFFKQERIFSTELFFSEGIPTITGDDKMLRSGIYLIHETIGSVQLCHIDEKQFQFPLCSYENSQAYGNYFTSWVKPCSLPFSTRSEIDMDSISEDVVELLGKITADRLLECKHQLIISTTTCPTQVTAACSSPSASFTAVAKMDDNTFFLERISRKQPENAVFATPPPPSPRNAAAQETAMSSDPSSSLTSFPVSSKSSDKMDVSPLYPALRGLPRSPRRRNLSSVYSDSTTKTPRNDRQEYRRVRYRRGEERVPYGIATITEVITFDNWDRIYQDFVSATTITETRREEALMIAIGLQRHLIKTFQTTHDFDQMMYLKSIDLVNLSDEETILFLFAAFMKNNFLVGWVLFELLTQLVIAKKEAACWRKSMKRKTPHD